MPNNSDNIGQLYNSLRNAGYDDIGTEQEFREYVSDENNVKNLHAALEDAGYDDIGSEQEFSEWLRPKQEAPQEQPQKAASSQARQQPEQPQQEKTSIFSRISDGISRGLNGIKDIAEPKNFMNSINAYAHKRDVNGRNEPAEQGPSGVKNNLSGLVSRAAEAFGIGGDKQQEPQPQQTEEIQQTEQPQGIDAQTQNYYNQLKELYDNKVKPGTESAYRQMYDLGSGDEGDYGVIITPKGGTYNDEGVSVVNTRDAQGNVQTEARLGTGRRDAKLAQAVDMFAHDKAREEADRLLKNVSEGVDPGTAFDELKASYYTDAEQDRLWSVANKIGIPYDEFIENYIRPAINESAEQTHNGLTFPVGQLTADWGKAGEQDKEYDPNALNMSEKTIYDYLLKEFDKKLASSKAEGEKAAANINAFGQMSSPSAYGPIAQGGVGSNAYREYNKYADPQKAIEFVVDKLYNSSYGNGSGEGDGRANINKQAIGKLLYRRIVDKLVSERIPKSKWGYVLKGFMDSDLGNIFKASTETSFQRHLDELADSKYSRSLKGFEGMLATGGHEALKFIADSWEYYLGGNVGNFAVGTMRSRAVRKMTEDLVMRGVKESTARGIAARVLSSTAQTALQKGKQAAVHGAATMATASTISGSLRQGLSPAAGAKLDEIEERRAGGETISKKQEQQELAEANSNAHNIFNVLGTGIKEGASGAVSGLAFGPGAAIGDAVSKLTGRYMGSLASSAAGYLSKLGTNATSMTALAQLEGSITGQRPEGSIANQFMQNLVTFAMMDAQGKMNSFSLHPFRDARSRREAEYKHIISDEDQKRMRDAGYGSLLDSIDKLGIHGNDTYEDTGVNYKMMQFLGDKSLPEELKAKYYRVITGRDMPLSPVTGSEVTHDEKGYYVVTYNPNGDVVSDHMYRTKAEADKMNAEYQKDVDKNTLKVLEDTVSDADFLDDLDIAEQYARENAARDGKTYEEQRDGVTDDDKDVLLVANNRETLGETIRKYQSGAELTSAEQAQLSALVRLHTKIKETRIKSMRKNVERDNNLSEGGLQQAIDGHKSKEEAQRLASEGEQVYKSADGKWRTNDEIGALDDYRMQLEDMLRERAGSDGPQTGDGPQDNAGTQPQAEEGNKIGENRGLPYEPTEFEISTNNSIDAGKRIIGDGNMMIVAAGFAEHRQRALSDFGAVFDGNGKDAEKVRQLATILDSHDSAAMQEWLDDNTGNLSDEQRDAVMALWDCSNVESGVQQQIEVLAGEAGEKERKDCEQYVGSDGNITTLTTKGGENYFYLSGDMSDIDGSIIVADADGERKQIYVSDISSKGEPVSLEQHIIDVQNQLRQKLQDEYNDIANGRTLQPGMEADVIINGSLMHIKCTVEDENGVTAELPDGSTYTFSHDELETAINGARQQRAAAAAEAAAQAKAAKEREERFKNDIVGYAEGNPDLSASETNAKTAAEYLQYLEQQGQSHDDIKQKLRDKVLEYANKADGVSEKINKLKSEYSILDSESEEAKEKGKEIEEAEQELRGLKSRTVKEARLRNGFLTDDEHSQEAQERQAKIRDIEGKLPEDSNMPDVALPDMSKDVLIGNYESKEDAAQYLDSVKEKLKQDFNTARDDYDDSDRIIREYQNGEYPYTDDELSNALAKRSKAKADMDALSKAAQDIDKVKKALSLIYKDVPVKGKEPEDIDWHSITNRKELLKAAREAFGADWDYDDSQEQTPEAIVAQELPAHSLLASDMMQELGVTWNDLKHLSYYFGNPDKERAYNRKLMTVKAAAEYCLSDVRDMLGDTIDEQDIRNAILEMFRSASKPSDIYNYDIYEYIDNLLEQRAAEREAEEQAKEEEEEYQSYLEGEGAQLADAQDIGAMLADTEEREKEYGKQMEEAQRQIDELKKQGAYDEQKKKDEEEAQRKKQEALEKLIKENEEKLRKLKEEQDKAKKAAEAERKAKEEATRKADEEKKRKEQEAADKKADEEKQEAARQAYEKAYRTAMGRQRLRKEQQAEAERRRKAEEEAEEAARKAAEEAEKKAKEEAARKEAEEKAKAERERKAKEEAERKAAEAARAAEKKEAERKMKEAAERKAKEEADRQQKEKEKGQGKKNEGQFGLVSDERMEELKKRLREKLSQLNAGFDPELLAIGLEMTAGYVDRGIKRFADFAKQMKEDFGDKVVPYLKAFYNGARDMPEVTKNGMDKEMDKYEDVSSFDLSKIDSYKPAEKTEGKTAEQPAGGATEKPADNKENGQQPEQPAEKEVNLDNFETDKYSITKQFNEYKGKDIWVVRVKGPRVDKSLFNRWRKWAKFYDGYWSSYKGVNGFVFTKPEKAKNFAEDEFPDAKETEQPKEAAKQQVTEQQPSTERGADKPATEQHDKQSILSDKMLSTYEENVNKLLSHREKDAEAFRDNIKGEEETGYKEFSNSNDADSPKAESIISFEKEKIPRVLEGNNDSFQNMTKDGHIDGLAILELYEAANMIGRARAVEDYIKAVEARKTGDKVLAEAARRKKEAENTVNLRQTGDFIEAVGEDAEKLAKATGISVTDRNGQKFAGFPKSALDSYLKDLVESKYKVKLDGKELAASNEGNGTGTGSSNESELTDKDILDAVGNGDLSNIDKLSYIDSNTADRLKNIFNEGYNTVKGSLEFKRDFNMLSEDDVEKEIKYNSNKITINKSYIKPGNDANATGNYLMALASAAGKLKAAREFKAGMENDKPGTNKGNNSPSEQDKSANLADGGKPATPQAPSEEKEKGNKDDVRGVHELRPEGLRANGDNEGEHSEGQGEEAAQDSKGNDGKGESRSVGRVQPGYGGPVRPGERVKNGRNNHAERGVDYAPKSVDARIKANIDAITTLKEILFEGREATPEEMEVLRKFSGWGGLGKAFSKPVRSFDRNETYDSLKQLLTDDELNDAEMSRNSAYYTPAPVIDSMWDIARALGFKGGNVLEGSAGIGNIIGLMPQDISRNSSIHAVEIDSVTGNILKLLYPDAKTEVQGFENTRVRNGSVDLSITNVPFVTGLRVNDTTGDKDLSNRFNNIHDFCIAKNIRKLKPGGIGIFITSNGTLDNSDSLRQWITSDGDTDVIAAFRMNNKTFGGTAATSDIVVVRRRVNGQKSPMAIDVSKVGVERVADFTDAAGKEHKVPITYNQYFIDHPEMMGGRMYAAGEKGDTFRPDSKGLFPENGISQQERLENMIKEIAEKAKEADSDQSKAADESIEDSKVYEALGPGVKEGSLVLNKNGELCTASFGEAVPIKVNKNKVKGHTKQECFNDYTRLKNAVQAVLGYETANDDDRGLEPLMKELNSAYDDFTSKYGPLNKNTAISFLKNDIDFPSIAALEPYKERNDANGKRVIDYKKSDIFNKRVISKPEEPHPTTIEDGISTSIFKKGKIDTSYIAKMLGKNETEVKEQILNGGLGYENPATGDIEPAYIYLSGNVREKLDVAEGNNDDGHYDSNIKALSKVLPPTLPIHLIQPTMGSTWIDHKIYEKYIKDKTGIDVRVKNTGGQWVFDEPTFGVNSEKNRAAGVYSKIADRHVLGTEIIKSVLTGRTIVVSRTKWDGTVIRDAEATKMCADKASDMKEDFKQYVSDYYRNNPEDGEKAEKDYNYKFNNYVKPEIPDSLIPEHFEFASHDITLRAHQAKAAMRAVTGNIMFAHEVGSGKTFTIITAAMEMRRLGTAKKPMIVVQNATVEQFIEQAKRLYPNAKILTINDKDRTKEGRRAFYAKIRYNDWDMVVIPQSVLDMIPDSAERKMDYIRKKIAEKEAVLQEIQNMDDSSATRQANRELSNLQDQLADVSEQVARRGDSKRHAVALQNAQVNAERQLDRRIDEDVTDFDELGIDALFVDEAHNYKHLGFETTMRRGVKGVDPSASPKCASLYLKCQSVMERTDGKNIVFATGTPISNTAAEIWTFMKYLMPEEKMKSYGIYYFDDFAKNFGDIDSVPEFSTSGKFKDNNRFKGYNNLPELVRIWSTVSDTVLSAQVGSLQEKIPAMEGGKARDIYLPQTRALRSIMKYVRQKLEEFDNMTGREKAENSAIPLVMYGIAKKAAVDPRLVSADAPDDPNSKTNATVRETLKALKDSEKYKGTVAIFADNYKRTDTVVENGKHVNKVGFNLFDDIKNKLIEAGVPAEQIAVIGPGMDVKKKTPIFDKVNAGQIRVVLGSTETLGTGVNMQERLFALIHIDAPNRPMDYTQRNGRILRQGNIFKQLGIPVRILRFGVEDSLDVTAYQRLKTKGAIADSIMHGEDLLKDPMSNRTIEEEDDIFGDTVANLSGSQFALLKQQAEKELKKLQRKQKEHENDQLYIQIKKPQLEHDISVHNKRIKKYKNIIEQTSAAKEKGIEIGGKKYASVDDMKDVFANHNKSIAATTQRTVKESKAKGTRAESESTLNIKINGFDFSVVTTYTAFNGKEGERYMDYSCKELGIDKITVRGARLITAVKDITENIVTGKDAKQYLKEEETRKAELEKDLGYLKSREGKPFELAGRLKEMKIKVAEYDVKMRDELKDKEAKYAEMDKDLDAANLDEVVKGDTEARFQLADGRETPGAADTGVHDAVVRQLKDSGIDVVTDKDEYNKALEHVQEGQEFKTGAGETYGFTVGGKIYLNPDYKFGETPLHEYAHLWSAALRNKNPKEWENIKSLLKNTWAWEYVKKHYPHLKTEDEIADEALSQFSGKHGAEKLRQAAEETEGATDERTRNMRDTLEHLNGGKAGGIRERIKAGIEKVKQALSRYWNNVCDLLHVHFTTAEEVADRVTADMLNGYDPTKDMTDADLNADVKYHKASKEEAAKLDKEKTVKLYRAMQVIDGKLYPPMMAAVKGKLVEPRKLGEWEIADERPGIIKYTKVNKKGETIGYVDLDKGSRDATGKKAGKVPDVAYNPYWHSSRSPLNDQFSSAWIRPNLVTVEVEVPESELTSGYRAKYAKDPVGETDWKAGTVTKALTALGHEPRKVVLSRFDKPVRVLSNGEVADRIAEYLGDYKNKIEIPENVVTPQVAEELKKRGVRIGEPEKGYQDKKAQLKDAIAKGLTVRNDLVDNDEDIMLRRGGTAKEYTAEEKSKMQQEADNLGTRLGGENITFENNGHSGIKGWYDSRDGSVHINLDEADGIDDVKATVCHEKLGHEGLGTLFGDQQGVDAFGAYIYATADKNLRKKIVEKANENGYSWTDSKRYSKAAQEVFSDMAQKGPANPSEFSLWRKVKHYIIRKCKEKGIKVQGLLNDKDMRYYVLKTGEGLKTWQRMTDEQRADAAKTGRVMYSKRGKPRQKKGESMGDYLLRLSEYQKWKNAEKEALANNDPMPDEKKYTQDAEERYKQALSDWKRANGFAEDEEIGPFPKREDGETPQDYAVRVADYEEKADKWKDAPGYFSWLKHAQDKWREDYRAWMERYDLHEQESVDEQLFEGGDGSKKEETPQDQDAQQTAEQEVAQEAGIDITHDGAKRQIRRGVIERRKNLESSNMEDAIFCHDIAKNIAAIEKEKGYKKGELAKGLVYMIERPLQASEYKDEIERWVNYVNMHPDFEHLHITADDMYACTDELGEITDTYLSGGDLTDICGRLAGKLNDMHKGDAPIDRTDLRKFGKHLANIAKAMQEERRILDEIDADDPEIKQLLQKVHDWYDNFYHLLEDAGLKYDETGYISNGYVNHVWDRDKSDPQALKIVENIQRTTSANMKKRQILTYADGEALGLVPKFNNLSKIMAYYSVRNNEAIANRKFLDDLTGYTITYTDDAGEDIAQLPMITTDKPTGDVMQYYHPGPYHVAGVGDIYVLNDVRAGVRSVFGNLRTTGVDDWVHTAGHAWDVVGGVQKKIQLSLSAFHMGALSEVAIAQMINHPVRLAKTYWKIIPKELHPVTLLKNVFRGQFLDSLRNSEIPAYNNPEDAKFAAKHLVQLGATQDYAAADVNMVTEKFRELVKQMAKEQGIKGAAGTALTPLAVMLDWVNKGIDRVLWNYLHDGLKIFCFKSMAADAQKFAAKHDMSPQQVERLLDEVGQYTNDTFGGQYWELLDLAPATVKWLRRALLSPDWLVSTQRHFFSNFGFGRLYDPRGFCEYAKQKTGMKEEPEDMKEYDLYRQFRSHQARICYVLGVGLFFYTVMNGLNALFRWRDEKEQQKEAEEMRKKIPDYKSPYELAYPGGMKWYDYTMLGNSLGQQTHLYWGRYQDGTETYVRWGKQFREFPEMFLGPKGFDFPGAMIQRMMGKSNPNIGLIRDNLGALGIWGFSNDYSNQEIQNKYGRTIGLLAKNAQHFLPFSVPTRAEKEFKLVDLVMPSAKGFSRYKAVDYFTDFIKAGDMEGVVRTYNAAVMNKIDAEQCLNAAIQTVKAEQRDEMKDGITDLPKAMSAFDNATTTQQKRLMRNKIIKYLAAQDYDAFTREEALQMIKDYQTGDNVTEKAGDKYINMCTAADIRDDYRFSAAGKQAKKYVDKLKDARNKRDTRTYNQLVQRYRAWVEVDKVCSKERTDINKLKNMLGKGHDREVLKKMRETRVKYRKVLDNVQPPR